MARSNSPRLVLRGYFPHDSIVSIGLKPLLLLALGLIQYPKSFPLRWIKSKGYFDSLFSPFDFCTPFKIEVILCF